MNISELLKRDDRANAFFDLVDLYVKGPDSIRRQIRQGWDFNVEWKYPNSARLACSRGEKRSCQERLKASLVYYSIEDCRFGRSRENLIAFAAIYHSCVLAGVDPVSLFESVSAMSSDTTAQR